MVFLVRIDLNDVALDFTVPKGHLFEHIRLAVEYGVEPAFEKVEIPAIGNDRMFDGFDETRPVLSLVERRECGHVDVDR